MTNLEIIKEVSPLSDMDCFIVSERNITDIKPSIHIHPECELTYIWNSKGALRVVGDSVEEIGDEDLFLIANPELEHGLIVHDSKPNIYEISVKFHPDFLSMPFMRKNQFISICDLFKQAERGVAFNHETISKVCPLIKTLTYDRDSFYSLIKLIIILHELSLQPSIKELSTQQFTLANAPNSNDEKMNRVISYLNSHYSDVIHLKDVADLANMSESSFCKFIKQRTSKSFVDFLTDIRLGAASRALIDSNRSISEISYSCGFNNLSNFNRIFKKKKHCTPSTFRESFKNKTIV